MNTIRLVPRSLAIDVDVDADDMDSPSACPPGLPLFVALGNSQLIELIDRIRERDGVAMARLHHGCASRVRAVALRIVQSPALADEVVADCFWQVWREAGRFDPQRGSALSWILAIARSRGIDAIRKRAVSGRYEVPLEELPQEQVEPACTSPAARLEVSQRDRRLMGLLATADPLQRQLLSLAFVCGLSHQEVATHSGLALGTVKSHIRRGLAAMRMRCESAGLAAG